MRDYLSTINIPIEDIPEAKRWKVGKKYHITAEVEQTGINKERDYNDLDDVKTSLVKNKKTPAKYRTMVQFKICNISARDNALKEKMEKEEKEY